MYGAFLLSTVEGQWHPCPNTLILYKDAIYPHSRIQDNSLSIQWPSRNGFIFSLFKSDPGPAWLLSSMAAILGSLRQTGALYSSTFTVIRNTFTNFSECPGLE